MATSAVAPVVVFHASGVRVAGDVSNVALHVWPGSGRMRPHVGHVLRPGNPEPHRENETEHRTEKVYELQVLHSYPQNEFAGDQVARGFILVRSRNRIRSGTRWGS